MKSLLLLLLVEFKMLIPFAFVPGAHSLHITGRPGGSGREYIVCYSVE